jgi:nucleoside phosphorylase
MATSLEAEPFLSRFGLREEERRPVIVYRSGPILLALSGIGKANAAIATTYCCARYRPRWVLNAGAAGALTRAFSLGEYVPATRVVEVDRSLLRADRPHLHIPFILDGFREAVLATRDTPVIEPADRKAVSAFADLIDMEGASVIQAARRFDIPAVVFKFVSDTPDHSAHDDIVALIRQYRGGFCDFIGQAVMPLLGTTSA